MTPMQEQYNQIKDEYKGYIVLFRLGDFYEAFNDDAVEISKVLGITLTGRGKDELRHPMAGIPYHALPNYLPKLVDAGIKVVIADQMEEPVPGKLVERKVTKVITPGTVLDENSLDSSKNNYIASIINIDRGFALSYCDLSTGELIGFQANSPQEIKIELNKLKPAEVLCIESQYELIKKIYPVRLEKLPERDFNYDSSYKLLTNQFRVNNLKGFGIEDAKGIIQAAGGLLKYLIDCQKTEIKHIKNIRTYNRSDYMQIDPETVRNLEIIYPAQGNDLSCTLLGVLNNCKNPMGKRKLRQWILNPLVNIEMLQERLDSVDYFFNNVIITSDIRNTLNTIADLERISGRIGVNTANPKDIVALKLSLEKSIELLNILNDQNLPIRLKFLKNQLETQADNKNLLGDITQAINIINESINDDPPASINEGGILKPGFNKEVDEYRNIRQNSKQILAQIQQRESERTKIPSLKISYNQVFGYYIEITRTHLDKVPAEYVRKQTLANAERYITQELKELEDKILFAEDKLIKIEQEVFFEIRNKISEYLSSILKLGDVLAEIDVLSNFGFISREYRYVKAKINTASELKIINGRHPVVENIVEKFTANSSEFGSDKYIHILTGPNMSGKSTYIRQVALITLIAQIGCFVPADSMEFGIVDRIFTRVGASDNLSKGESTFMVEMTETANILNNATNKSLVILDEVGRGTSTYDGVAIAWSIIEYLYSKIKCKTLFATHYHELIELEKKYKGIKNYNVEVIENNGEILFKHKIIEGGTNKSYGVHVAKLAGVPNEVIERAHLILRDFESGGKTNSNTTENDGLKKTLEKKSPLKPKKIHPEQLGLI